MGYGGNNFFIAHQLINATSKFILFIISTILHGYFNFNILYIYKLEPYRMAFSVIIIHFLQNSKHDIGGGGLLGGIKNSIGHVANQIEVSIM